MVQQKVGLLGGLNWGRGCILARLPDGSWSPPCFLRMRHASLGLTFGMRRINSCYVLQARRGAVRVQGRGSRSVGSCCWAGLRRVQQPHLPGGPPALPHPLAVSCLQSQEQMQAFARSKSDCGFDAAVSQDADPFDKDAPEGGVTLLK